MYALNSESIYIFLRESRVTVEADLGVPVFVGVFDNVDNKSQVRLEDGIFLIVLKTIVDEFDQVEAVHYRHA
jgi:hypothetical protein